MAIMLRSVDILLSSFEGLLRIWNGITSPIDLDSPVEELPLIAPFASALLPLDVAMISSRGRLQVLAD